MKGIYTSSKTLQSGYFHFWSIVIPGIVGFIVLVIGHSCTEKMNFLTYPREVSESTFAAQLELARKPTGVIPQGTFTWPHKIAGKVIDVRGTFTPEGKLLLIVTESPHNLPGSSTGKWSVEGQTIRFDLDYQTLQSLAGTYSLATSSDGTLMLSPDGLEWWPMSKVPEVTAPAPMPVSSS